MADKPRSTYSQLLRHPKWQERRLRALEKAEFRCSCCDDNQTTLHVHHRVYYKGKMPWEYADEDLVVLCEPCHEDSHRTQAGIKEIVARSSQSDQQALFALIGGFMCCPEEGPEIDPGLIEEARQTSEALFVAGIVGAMLCVAPREQSIQFVRAILSAPSLPEKAKFHLEDWLAEEASP